MLTARLYFDRKKFFDGYRSEFGSVSQSQVDGLEQLLTFIENDRYVTSIEDSAFFLGTTKHETADTFKPIHEYGGKAYFIKRYGSQTKVGKQLGNDTPEEGYFYAGKGYPQATGESNYEKLEDAIREEYPEIVAEFERRTGKKFDLTVGDQPNDTSDPQNMLDPAIAYVSMSYGSRTGLFTGRKLSQYNLSTGSGRRNSRRIINGMDQADKIAGYIVSFIKILKASQSPATQNGAAEPNIITHPSDDPVVERRVAEPGAGEIPVPEPETPAPPALKDYAPKPSFWEKMTGAQEKVDKVSSFGNSLSPISNSSRFNVVLTKASGYILLALGFFVDHWLWVLGVVLILAAIWYLREAKKNAASRNTPASSQEQKQTVVIEKV